jgi:AraC-like DNA-binding protein
MKPTIHYENISPSPAQQIALSRVIQEPGERHWHFTHFHTMHELIYYYSVNDGFITVNGVEYPLKSNTLAFIPSMTVHDVLISENIKRSWVLLQFEPDILPSLQFSIHEPAFTMPSVLVPDDESRAHFEHLLEWYASCVGKDPAKLTRRILGLLLHVAIDIIKSSPAENLSKLSSVKGIMQFTPLLTFLESKGVYNISLDDAAKMCGLSRYHFSRLFKVYFSINFNEYLLKRKLNLAMSMLVDPTASISQISLFCGFSDSAYFCKKFKAETGKTPRQFRSDLN